MRRAVVGLGLALVGLLLWLALGDESATRANQGGELPARERERSVRIEETERDLESASQRIEATPPAPSGTPRPLAIEAEIIDLDGKSVQPRRVRVERVADGSTVLRLGSPDRRFRLTGLADEPYRLHLQIFSGKALGRLPDDPVLVRGSDGEVRIRLEPQGNVHVSVVDAGTGASLTRNSRLRIVEPEPKPFRRGTVPAHGIAWEQTDLHDGWRVWFPLGRSVAVQASADGYLDSDPIRVTGGNDALDFREVDIALELDPAGLADLEILVTDESGVPLEGVLIYHRRDDGTGHGMPGGDTPGTFRRKVPVGRQRFQVESTLMPLEGQYYVPRTVEWDLPGHVRTRKTIVLKRAGLLVVSLPRGARVLGVYPKGQSEPQGGLAGLGPQGRMIPPGSYRVVVLVPDGPDLTRWVEMRAGEKTHLDLTSPR
ncbi:MAG: hypothetical protein AAGD14_10615 [Planctomycetota bacterium]